MSYLEYVPNSTDSVMGVSISRFILQACCATAGAGGHATSQPAHFVLDGAVLVIKPCFESCWAANQKVVKSGQGSWPGSAAGEAAGAN
jgi:hypothetical protein